MKILTIEGWDDYELIDSGEGRRLERFGKYILDRPDPQIIWKKGLSKSNWDKADAFFERTEDDKGKWIQKVSMPEKWPISYKNLSFWVKLSPFKHTGIFPEQSVQWDFINEMISKSANEQINILNLFGYTGGATLTAANAEAKVTHLDASRPAITWANENQELSKLKDRPIRWIIDDAVKFTEREIKRGVKYDGIVMDPPIYGHGPKGEPWNFNKDFPKLLENCKQLLSQNPLFVIVNAYAISSSSLTLGNVLSDCLKGLGGNIETGELTLKEKSAGRLLSTGIFATWSK